MIMSQKELGHVVFLAEVAAEGHKRGLLEEAIQCLSYVVKSLPEADLPPEVVEEIRASIDRMEQQLRVENEKLHDIRHNLETPAYQRSPFGK